MFDVTIIGAGVVGSCIARELSKYDLKACVVEKEIDVAMGTSKANSGIVHAGEDPKTGTNKAKYNVLANPMFDKLSEELDFPFKRNGSLVLCFDEEGVEKLEEMRLRGLANGLPDTMKIVSREEVLELEPNLSDEVYAALTLPTGGIVCPYEMTIAFAENAADNGVEFKMETMVTGIEKQDACYKITTDKGEIETKLIVNAAGVFADKMNNMVSDEKIEIVGRKGEYALFDKSVGEMVERTLFQLPTKMGKGVLATPTVDGNLLLGPTAEDVEDKDNVDTSKNGLDFVFEKALKSIKQVPMRQVITSFSGIRAHSTGGDFIIGEAKDAKNFINAAGIESPGLTSAPAIAVEIERIVVEKFKPAKNEGFNPVRRSVPRFREMDTEERKALIAQDKSYGQIVCRCETVTEGEIKNAVNRTLGAKTLDGVKRRTRAGMGRCQSGFCSTKVVDIIAQETGMTREDVTKFGKQSNFIVGKIKESI